MKIWTATIAMCLLIACQPDADQADDASPAPQIRIADITVSGFDSGGYMANQLQLAFSRSISGVAILGAGPYFCSQGELALATSVCREGGNLAIARLSHHARDEAAAGRLDTLNNLNGVRVWAFHGKADRDVQADVSYAAIEIYETLADEITSKFVEHIPAGHGFPTEREGHQCQKSEAPYLAACNYDAAGELLRFLTNRDVQANKQSNGDIINLSQDGVGLAKQALAYVPSQCYDKICDLHVALHGCQQSVESVGQRFVENAGYNRWADALDLVVLYPQARASNVDPENPQGCWDWWGFSGSNFSNREGPQIKALGALITSISGQEL